MVQIQNNRISCSTFRCCFQQARVVVSVHGAGVCVFQTLFYHMDYENTHVFRLKENQCSPRGEVGLELPSLCVVGSLL